MDFYCKKLLLQEPMILLHASMETIAKIYIANFYLFLLQKPIVLLYEKIYAKYNFSVWFWNFPVSALPNPSYTR